MRAAARGSVFPGRQGAGIAAARAPCAFACGLFPQPMNFPQYLLSKYKYTARHGNYKKIMNTISYINRRSFIKLSAGAALATAAAAKLPALRGAAAAQSAGANDTIRVGVIGLGRKGPQSIKLAQEVPGVRIVALCDVDPVALARQAAALQLDGPGVFRTTDARRLLERSDVDAVIITTADHWHALLTIWACQAGKDVYVEKPVSHTIWEGGKMMEAAKKYNRVVQSGSQLRSDTGLAEAARVINAGELGKIKYIRGFCYTKRGNIGKKTPWYPSGLDYNLWCGPAPVVPLRRNELNYDWHWSWDTGDGDLVNMGAHVIDITRRFAGGDALPRRILSAGGCFGHDDAAETPNTLLAVFDYPEFPLVYEVRGLTSKPGVDNMDHYKGLRTGVIVQCEGGYYSGYIGGGLYDNGGKLVRRIRGDGGVAHFPNFFDAVRSRKTAELAAPLAVGHAASSTCHFANISYRTGASAPVENINASLAEFPVAQEAAAGMARHLAAHNVDLDMNKTPLTLGGWLVPDFAGDSVKEIEGAGKETLERAVFLARGVQRPPYIIPENI